MTDSVDPGTFTGVVIKRADVLIDTADKSSKWEMEARAVMMSAVNLLRASAQRVPIADLQVVIDIADRNEYVPQISRVKAWLSSLTSTPSIPAQCARCVELRETIEMASNRLEAAVLGGEPACGHCIDVAQSYLKDALSALPID